MAKLIIFHTPVRYGGGERQLILLAKEFRKQNLDFVIINLAKSDEFEKELKKEEINFFTITNKSLGDSTSKKQYLFHFLSLLTKIFNKNLKNFWDNAKIIWARDFPANFFVYVLLKIFGKNNKKLIYSRHSYKKPEQGIFKVIYSKVLNRFDKLIGVSAMVSESLKNTFPTLQDKIITIPNGIDLTPFEINETKEKLRFKLNLPLNQTLAIYISRFTLLKNHIFLIDVANKINNFLIVLIGEGETKEEILKKIKEEKLEDRFLLLGYVKNDLVPLCLKASDLCIFPSKIEGFSNAILEAMASGLPVVIFKDIYSQEYGENILVANNEDEFINYTKKLVEDEKFRKELGEKLKQDALKLDIKNIAEKYLEIFLNG
jgi:glycosyltransferase involved in cell wall biosynthesis